MFSATSWASISGLSISLMLMNTSRLVRLLDVLEQRRPRRPCLPIMMPGRAVWMLTFSLFAASLDLDLRDARVVELLP